VTDGRSAAMLQHKKTKSCVMYFLLRTPAINPLNSVPGPFFGPAKWVSLSSATARFLPAMSAFQVLVGRHHPIRHDVIHSFYHLPIRNIITAFPSAVREGYSAFRRRLKYTPPPVVGPHGPTLADLKLEGPTLADQEGLTFANLEGPTVANLEVPTFANLKGLTVADPEIRLAEQMLAEAHARTRESRHEVEIARLGAQVAQLRSAESYHRFREAEIRLQSFGQIHEDRHAEAEERGEEGDIMPGPVFPGAATNHA
jgi:hypothetical protein